MVICPTSYDGQKAFSLACLPPGAPTLAISGSAFTSFTAKMPLPLMSFFGQIEIIRRKSGHEYKMQVSNFSGITLITNHIIIKK